jgi:hypothetical protein
MSQIEHLPVTSDVIQRESRRDNVLARKHDHVTNGWKDTDTYGMLKPLYSPRNKNIFIPGMFTLGHTCHCAHQTSQINLKYVT